MIDYVVVSLTDIISQYKDISILEEAFQNFKCQREVDLETFLQNKCLKYEEAGNCRTFLLLDKKKLDDDFDLSIIAFFSTAMTPLDISSLGKKLRKKIHGPLPLNKKVVPVFLIGQLGRNDLYSKHEMPGEVIIGECFAAIERAKQLVGGRILLVECRERLLNFYENHNFVRVSKNEDSLYQLYKKIA